MLTTYASEASAKSAKESVCPIDPSWITNPSLPQEVKKSGADGSSNFCDFYQFSNQTYLYLMSPSGDGSNRNFQVQSEFPLLEHNDDGSPANSCDPEVTGITLRSNIDKSLSTDQAGGGATIYAQDGNVIYYDVRFNKPLCGLTASAVEMLDENITNFPAGTMEMKFAWKVLSQSEIASNKFVTQNQPISGKPVTLGLVGMHIARATKDHPEFVWATYEHKVNTPDCTPAAQQSSDWMFASKSCTQGLPASANKGNVCNFNSPKSNLSAPTGTPTNICRVYPYGTADGDLKAELNVSDITQQNTQILAQLKQPTTSASMKTLTNYFNVGALWASKIQLDSGGVGVPNERGSLRLANSVAETDYQHVNIESSGFISNCFGCHNYAGSNSPISNNITKQSLSHTFRDIKVGQGEDIDVSASQTIMGNNYAAMICRGSSDEKGVCPKTDTYLAWNGNWTNINPSAGSVCGCTLAK